MTENKKFADAIDKLINAKYGVEVRDAAVEALQCCYTGIANTNSDEFYKALLKAADEGSINSLINRQEPIKGDEISDKSIPASKLSSDFMARIKKVEDTVAELTRQLEENRLKAQNELPISNRLAEAERAMKSIQETILSLKNQVEEHKKQIAKSKELSEQLKGLGENINDATKQIKENRNSLTVLHDEHGSSLEAITAELSSLKEKMTSLRQIQNSYDEILKTVTALKETEARHDKTISKLSGAYGTLLERQGIHAKTISNHSDVIEENFKSLTSQTKGITVEVDGLKVDVTMILEDAATTKHNLSTVKDSIRMLEKVTNSAYGDIVSSKESISILEKEIDAIKLDMPIVSKVSQSMDSLDSRIIDLESDKRNSLADDYERLLADVQNLKRENEEFRRTVNSSIEHILKLIGEKLIGVG